MKRFPNLALQVRAGLAGALLVAAASSLALNTIAGPKGDRANAKVDVVVDDTPIVREGGHMTSFAPVIDEVSPSVVNIFTITKGKRVEGGAMPFNDPFFRRFFGDRSGQGRGNGGRDFFTPDQRGLGSGVIISRDGYILTNNHVIQDADEILVAMHPDKKEYTAEVVGRDPRTDIAVLKIDADSLPYVKLADSEQVRVGDLALAIGNPFGIGQTVTMGMVSAKGRSGAGLDYEDFIQTDAAINPGNSGGALVDAKGRLIGINTLIISRSGGNHGIGYAIPINLARHVMEELIEDGRVSRGYLGVGIQDLTAELAKAFDVDDAKGALVSSIEDGGAADKAGIRTGDIITEFNGKKVRDSRNLKNLVGQTDPDADVSVTLLRKGKTREFSVRLGVRDEAPALAGSNQFGNAEDDGVLDGVTVTDIDRETRARLNLPRSIKGALVVAVERDTPSYRDGLREGDVILEINREPVRDADEAVDLSERIDTDRVLLRIWRGGGSFFIVVNEKNVG